MTPSEQRYVQYKQGTIDRLLAWQPLPRRWRLWLPCALTRHSTGDSYCWCRAIVRFKIER